jgi:hypothetical protein
MAAAQNDFVNIIASAAVPSHAAATTSAAIGIISNIDLPQSCPGTTDRCVVAK